MNEILQHLEFGSIRTHKQSGQIWFCAKDVCEILNFTNSRSAVAHHGHEGDVDKFYTLTEGGKQELAYINESGLYALIFNSEKSQAKKFKHWVTSEVLPAIRKYGFYSTDPKKMANAQKRAELKAKKDLFTEIDKRISTSDKRIIGKQCLTTIYDVNKVLRVETEDVHMATLLYNKACGNKELHSAFYTHKGAEDLLKNLIKDQATI